MIESFSAYADWIELETFFSGSLILLALSWIFFRNTRYSGMAYALVATLYWGFLIKSHYPAIQLSILNGWAAVALLFWIPAVRNRSPLLFIHSIVFFFLMIVSLYKNLIVSPDAALRNNDLKIFAASLAINSLSLILILILIFKRHPDKSQENP